MTMAARERSDIGDPINDDPRKGRVHLRGGFVLCHRAPRSTIQGADVIAYMAGGNVVAQGSHAALLAAKGRCWALYESQFSNKPIAA